MSTSNLQRSCPTWLMLTASPVISGQEFHISTRTLGRTLLFDDRRKACRGMRMVIQYQASA